MQCGCFCLRCWYKRLQRWGIVRIAWQEVKNKSKRKRRLGRSALLTYRIEPKALANATLPPSQRSIPPKQTSFDPAPQKSFPINAGCANLSSLLLFSRTTGSLDSSSCARSRACSAGTSRPTLLPYRGGILTVNGSPEPASSVCPARVADGFARV